MTVYVNTGNRYCELDDDTPARNGEILFLLKHAKIHAKIQVFMDNHWCNVTVEESPRTIEVRMSVKTYLDWRGASTHIYETLEKSLNESKILSFRIMGNNEEQEKR